MNRFFSIATIAALSASVATAQETPLWLRQAAISPDGSTIAFNSDREGAMDVYVMSCKGGQPKRLTSTPKRQEGL